MGAITGLMGMNGGAGGTGFAGANAAQIENPTNTNQISGAYTGAQNSLQGQQALLQALQGQQGLANQSQVYNQQQGIVNGTGPNPAQAMLNQATGANVANQAALMAGQRGAGSNVGLIARQAAQQGAGIQQQAAGQGATMQANQSLNALNSAGSIANSQVANQVGQTNANAQAQQSEQGQLLGAQQGYNTNQVGSQSSINAANAGLANTQLQGQHGLIGGLLNGAGPALGLAGGGMVDQQSAFTPQSEFGQFLSSSGGGQPQMQMAQDQFAQDPSSVQMQKDIAGAFSPKPSAPASEGGGEQLGGAGANVSNSALNTPFAFAKGGGTRDFSPGGGVKAANQAQKAVAKGNSYANDKIPAVLSEGEVVIPRNVMMAKDPVNGAAQFVASVLAKKRGGR